MTIIFSTGILITSAVIAYLIIRNEKIHCDTLANVSLLIADIRNYALFSNMSFEKILNFLNETEKYNSLDFIKSFCKDNENIPVPERWKSSVENSECRLYQWEKDVLIRLCDSLCMCGVQNISAYCEKAYEDIENFILTAKEKKEKIIKTRAVLAVSTGVMIALLFI